MTKSNSNRLKQGFSGIAASVDEPKMQTKRKSSLTINSGTAQKAGGEELSTSNEKIRPGLADMKTLSKQKQLNMMSEVTENDLISYDQERI